jgi:hypothetical protein
MSDPVSVINLRKFKGVGNIRLIYYLFNLVYRASAMMAM